MKANAAVAMCLLSLSLAIASRADSIVASAGAAVREYHVSVPAPLEWRFVSSAEVPYHIPGQFLVGWSRETASGPAVIYVVGQRISRNIDARDVGRAVMANLVRCGLEPAISYGPGPFEKDSARVSARGLGTGVTLAKLTPSYGGDTPTLWVESIVYNDWSAHQGGDLLQIVMTCPVAAEGQFVPLYDALLDACKTTSVRYLPDNAGGAPSDPTLATRDNSQPPDDWTPAGSRRAAKAPSQPAPATSQAPVKLDPVPAPAAVKLQPAPSPRPQPAATAASSVRAGAAKDQDELTIGGVKLPLMLESGGGVAGGEVGGVGPTDDGAPAGTALDRTLVGSLHGITAAGVRTVNLRFLLADNSRGVEEWTAPPERDVPLYFCMSADKKTCYIVPAAALDALAEAKPTGGRILRKTPALEAYRDRWDFIWP